MARGVKADRERLARTDHYRLQVNVDQELMAFGYNLALRRLTNEQARLLRNEIKEAAEEALVKRLRLMALDPAWRRALPFVLQEEVADDVRDRAAALWQRLGA